MATPWPPICSYCKAAAGYAASCAEASVWVCKVHVGAACAVWLYDHGRHTVEVHRLLNPEECPSCGHGRHTGLCPVSACPCGGPSPAQLRREIGLEAG